MRPAELSDALDFADPAPRTGRASPVVCAGNFSPEHAALLRSHALPLATGDEREAFVLVEVEGRLELRPPAERDRAGIAAEFPPERFPSRAREHPLVRAFGRAKRRILDLTAGLGADAYRLAAAGHRVTGCERSPVVHALLASGWQHACAAGRVPDAIRTRLDFVYGEGLERLDATTEPELGVYLDPMYPPPRRASALPRRELQILRRFIGPDGDAGALVALARARTARVVVKRPHHAPPLLPGAQHVVESKLVRFDVYLGPGPGGGGRA